MENKQFQPSSRSEMSLRLRSDELFRDLRACLDINDELRDERSRIESTVKPVGEGGQVMA